MNDWFRWYDGTSRDGKFQVVAREAEVTVAEVIGVWAAILEDASCDDHRGMAMRGKQFYAKILNVAEPTLEQIIAGLERVGCIVGDYGNIKVLNWGKRQYETDRYDATNAERKRRWRERQRNDPTVPPTVPRNDPTVPGNGPVHPDTESDTDLTAERVPQPSAASRASAPTGARAPQPNGTQASGGRQGMSPDPGNDYRSPPATKSDNVLEPIPDRPDLGTGRRKRTY